MRRKTFIKTSTAAMAGGLILPWSACKTKPMIRKNWAGNLTYNAIEELKPANKNELIATIRDHDRIKALGTRHCFNSIADTKYTQVSTENLNKVISLNENDLMVTVESGIKYGQLAPYLEERGYALHNLASLPHISVGGACSTATHGSGVKNGNLSTAVRSIELIKANGEIINLSPGQDNDWFNGGVVGLGGLGVMSSLGLAIQKSFPMRQRVYQNLPLEELKNNFEAILSSGYSVSLFTDWLNNEVSQVWIKSQSGEINEVSSNEFYGAMAATKNLHPIVTLGAENCTEQLGIDGPWYERMPHFKMGFTPSSGEELQAEYFVPFENGLEAMLAIEKIKDKVYPLLLISEIRTIAADSFWMSPCYQQPCLSIHFTLKPDWEGVKKLLPAIEQELAPFRVKPHWGKLFTIPANELGSRYEKMPDFIQMMKTFDPEGKFRNDFLDTYVYANDSN